MAILYYTSDTHSYLYPEDHTFSGKRAMGYGLLSSSFKDADLLADGGDVLQGSPLIRYEIINRIRPFTCALAFNIAGLDIFVPGNHDFDFGPQVLKEFLGELDAQTVCANLEDLKWGMDIKKYAVKTFPDGLKVLITGVVTDFVNVWESKEKLDGILITDSYLAAKKVFEQTRNLGADFSILICHGGFGGPSLGNLKENRGSELCDIGYDIVATAHQHIVVDPHREGKSLSFQVGSQCEKAAKIILQKGREPQIQIIRASLDVTMKPPMRSLLYGPIKEKLEAFLDRKIGFAKGPLKDENKLSSALQGSSLADFINDLQLKASGADVSACSLFNLPVTLEGQVSMRELLAAYPFANSLVRLKIDGSVLKRALERSASYFVLKDGEPQISDEFISPKIQHYNYDYFRGVSYTFDISRPVGQRVTRLEREGIDLLKNPKAPLSIALNSYRATGTGGYEAYKEGEVEKCFPTEVQDLILDAFEQSEAVVPPPPTDFKVELGLQRA